MTTEQLLARFDDVTRTGPHQWSAKCPAHEDRRASLAVGEGAEGKVLLRCHAGCELDAVLAALELQPGDLFPAPAAPPLAPRVVATYAYHNERGELLFEVQRLEPKAFRQRKPDGRGGWEWKLNGVRRTLYRLPELVAADPASAVYIVEGEKDVHALERLGLLATTSPGGAGAWRSVTELAREVLRGRRVVVLPDNDDQGRKYAVEVARSLEGIASVRVVELPGLSPKGDVSDWIAAGGTRAELEALSERQPGEDDGEAPPSAPVDDVYGAVALRDFLGDDEPTGEEAAEWITEWLVAAREPNLIHGRPKARKTLILEHAAIASAAGLKWLDRFTTRQARWLFLQREGGLIQTRRRLWRLARGLGVDPRDLGEHLAVDIATPFYFDDEVDVDRMRRTLDSRRPDVVVIDSLTRSHRQNENEVQGMARVTNVWLDLCQRHGVAIIAIHHSTKPQPGAEGRDVVSGVRGSGDIAAVARHLVEVVSKDHHTSTVATAGNLPGHGEPFAVRVEDGHDVNGKPTIALTYGGSAEEAAAASLDGRILEALAEEPLFARDLRKKVRGKSQEIDGRARALNERGTIDKDAQGRWRITPSE